MDTASAALDPLRVASAMVDWTSGLRGRAVGFAVALMLALTVSAAPAGASGGRDATPAQGAVLGSFTTESAARTAWPSLGASASLGLPVAIVCALDGIADGPVRLVVPARDPADAVALCRTVTAAGRSCRPMAAPCASDGRVLDGMAARPLGTGKRVPPPGPWTAPWTALAEDLSGWSDAAQSEDIGPTVSRHAAHAARADAGVSRGVVDEAALAAATQAIRAGDHAAAVRLLVPRAQAGDPVAAHNLAILLAEGLGTARDDRAAARWMTVAAEAGLISAQNTLALMYLHGRGVARDRGVAVRWLAQAARGGHPLARANLLEVMRTSLALSSQSDAAKTSVEVTAGATAGASAGSAAAGGRDAGFAGLIP